ncbi:hypothetical protein L210DRAFT_985971 [Boletus edulis BED1]|uniref:Uncharacterized protein n=1 Tax=Boletus edulis BED1 TaxID=1328754 RepID=A0AAD4BI38_BOLED|nr:hypothetical protein L210DRAFT_985971 [Boletus edulis BED1]
MSDNELASALGQHLEAHRLVSPLPRASPVFVGYTSTPSPTTKAFVGQSTFDANPRPHPHRTVITLIKTTLSLSGPIHVSTALELAPYVHTLHVKDDLERPLTALSSYSTTLAGTLSRG